MEMQLETAQRRRQPLTVLPRGAEVKTFGLAIEVARGVAGCVICRRPIQKGLSRLVFDVALAEPVAVEGGPARISETYYAHVGCVTDRIKPEIPRKGTDCWDCGLELVKDDCAYDDGRCFTTSRFALAMICSRCRVKPRWRQCETCQVYYPHHMISEAICDRGSAGFEELFEAVPLYYVGDPFCDYCANRYAVPTRASEAERQAESERLRRDFEARKREIVSGGEL